jgi:para-nitrobenzyl esterase
MMASIAAFLRHGDPNCPALGVAWAPWPARIVLDAGPEAARIRTE